MERKLLSAFDKIYGQKAEKIYFSPGRVNLIGEHIDYNGGLVMPCAITMGTWLVIKPNQDNVFRFRSLDFAEKTDIGIQASYNKNSDFWFNYPTGVIDHFIKADKRLSGLNMLFYGNIPTGSGLSSSASIETVTAFALNDLFDCNLSKLDLVKMCKSVENNFIGVNSGIMDQFAVTFGETGKALILDCNTLWHEAVNCTLGDYALAIVDTNKPRKLVESKYNERVRECQIALKALKKELHIHHLCEIDTGMYEKYRHLISDPIIDKRAQHVIGENDRVKLATEALNINDLQAFGQLMYASHHSLQNLYEVSGGELDTVIAYCESDTDVVGARMTGAGFGGCAIALVKRDSFDSFSRKMTAYYSKKIGYAPSIYNSMIGDGAKLLAEPIYDD